jgi:hypothetical protein
VKRNGIFRPRLLACRYSQIPGVDFNESYVSLINNVRSFSVGESRDVSRTSSTLNIGDV